MNTSTYYSLNLVEGTDIVNPLVQDVPNYTAIDTAMHDNSVASVGLATELVSATVHAITRSNPDAPMFRYVATANWSSGDTMTVDGVQVSVFDITGTALAKDAYVSGSCILGCLVGTTVTLYITGGSDAATLQGHAASYFGTATDVTAANNTANSAYSLISTLNTTMRNLITGTLVAGTTTVTISDASILTTSVIDVYTDSTSAISFNTIAVSNGSVTLTFDAQASDLTVGIRVL